jgi:hypothetical protein
MKQNAWFLGKIFTMADLVGWFMVINPHLMSFTREKQLELIQLVVTEIDSQR